MINSDLYEKVLSEYTELTKTLILAGVSVSTMESCTAGLIATLITNTEGASSIMKGSFITYSNEAKVREGVPAEVIDTYGVYSKETAEAMAKAAAVPYGADLGIGVTGSIGRVDPENPDSVPGEVYLAFCFGEQIQSYAITLSGTGSRMDAKLEIAHVLFLMLKKELGL